MVVKNRNKLIVVLFITLVVVNIYLFNENFDLKNRNVSINWFNKEVVQNRQQTIDCSQSYENLSFDFNETGFPVNIVPNIVHYILITTHEIEFAHFVSILSVLKNQRPDQIYIHCDCHQLTGDYFQRVLRVANKTNTEITVSFVERETQIFGHNLSEKWLNWHLSDITRIRVLIKWGGIYLDRDSYVVQSLDVFRKYEMTLNWDQDLPYIAIHVLIAHKNARFLRLWLDSYHDYNKDQWFYNGGILPTKRYLIPRPDLIHRVKDKFGGYGPKVCSLIYSIYYPNWRQDFYAIHLVIRGNDISVKDWCFASKDDYPPIMSFNEEVIKDLNVTFGEMTRILFDFEKSLIN